MVQKLYSRGYLPMNMTEDVLHEKLSVQGRSGHSNDPIVISREDQEQFEDISDLLERRLPRHQDLRSGDLPHHDGGGVGGRDVHDVEMQRLLYEYR